MKKAILFVTLLTLTLTLVGCVNAHATSEPKKENFTKTNVTCHNCGEEYMLVTPRDCEHSQNVEFKCGDCNESTSICVPEEGHEFIMKQSSTFDWVEECVHCGQEN